jgi:integrase
VDEAQRVVQWLKANGLTRLLKRNDWPRYVETEPETYNAEEVEQFLAACDPFERALFEFFWMTGFRDAEVQHVTRADLDLKEQVDRLVESHIGLKLGALKRRCELGEGRRLVYHGVER